MMLPSIMSWPSMTIHDHPWPSKADCYGLLHDFWSPEKQLLRPWTPACWLMVFNLSLNLSILVSNCCLQLQKMSKSWGSKKGGRSEEQSILPEPADWLVPCQIIWGGWSSGKSSKARLGLKKASRFSTSPSWPTASCGLSWQLSTAPFGNWAAGRGVRHNLNAVIKPHMALAVSPSGFSIFSSPRPPRFQDAFSLTSGNFVSLILGHWDFGWDVTAPTNRKCSSWSIISQDLESPWH